MKFDLWIWGPRIGWWLHESGYDNIEDAAGSLTEAIDRGPDDWQGGAILPAGVKP